MKSRHSAEKRKFREGMASIGIRANGIWVKLPEKRAAKDPQLLRREDRENDIRDLFPRGFFHQPAWLHIRDAGVLRRYLVSADYRGRKFRDADPTGR